jgi:hypothetical protein
MKVLLMDAKDAVELLNRMREADPEAMANLCNYHTECNQALANLPGPRVRGGHLLGMLGVLNGLFNDQIVAEMQQTCPNGCEIHPSLGIYQAGERCLTCGEDLVLGQVVLFRTAMS